MRAAFFVGFGGVTFPVRAFTDNSDVIILCPGLIGAVAGELPLKTLLSLKPVPPCWSSVSLWWKAYTRI